ncbi:TonB family protein [Methylobacterium durans]|uniref:Energy transducer TonB n=1 Tax=Methylobacterium durans TaxID=2202825 RepID=A0A2U8WD13_9HYPH|nr:TonB family protein [Methylobacterium durans]AWN43330.1 energy transducer TonB [Methylobacterium durans]
MFLRPLLLRLCVCVVLCLPAPGALRAEPAVGAAVRQWLSTVVTRIGAADRAEAPRSRGGTVTIRVRIAADGSLKDASVEGGSGSAALEARALAAARAAAPFAPPPSELLTEDGTTELSFPLDLARRR